MNTHLNLQPGVTPIPCRGRLAMLWIFPLACLLALSSQPAVAQTLFGSIVGSVTDASGAIVPAADVKITLTATNDSRTVQTDANGAYTISTVTPGTYRVEITKEGFRSFVASEILVNQNNVVRVDAQLQVGSFTEKVEVNTTPAAELQTDRADVHAEISTSALVELPQPNRTYEGLLELIPGTAPPGGQLQGGTNNPSKSMTFAFNGTTAAGGTVRIEGINALNLWNPGAQNYVPSIEAIQDVNVATSAADAEQGLAGGASVNVILKSGSNATHGGFYLYNTNSALEANDFFSTTSKPPHLVDNDTGVFGGGHIIRNKLFYFGSYEADINRAANSGILPIPNAVQLSGNMTGSNNPIYDPLTGNPDGTGRTPFPGNLIPQSRISPVVEKIIPNIPATNYGAPGAVVNNYFMNQANVYNLHKIDTKFDYLATNKLRVSARWATQPYYGSVQPPYGPILGGGWSFTSEGAGNYLSHGAGQAISASGSYVISPTFVIDATWGKTSSHQQQFPNLYDQRYGLDVLGIPGTNQGSLPWAGGVPQFVISSFAQMGESYPSVEYFQPEYEYTANATKIKGSHTIRFGADLEFQHPRHIEVNENAFYFTGGATSLNGGPGPNPYNSLSDFLLGDFHEGTNTVQFLQPYETMRTYEFAAYVRDQWHVNSKLTVNYGVRWEKYPVPTRDGSDNGELGNVGTGTYWENIQNATITICGTPGTGFPTNCGIHTSNKLFAPSIGIAYRPTTKYVVRAGYSLSPSQENTWVAWGNSQLHTFPGVVTEDLIGVNPFASAGNLITGIPIINSPTSTSPGVFPIPPNTGDLSGLNTNKNYVRGYYQSYNITVQRELPGGMLASVGYVGMHAVHLDLNMDINYGTLGGGTASQLYAWLPLYSSRVTTPVPLGQDHYNSLQATLNKRLSHGLTMQAAYTYSKDIGNMPTFWYIALPVQIPQYYWMDNYETPLDHTHHLVWSWTYELPFGKSKQWATHGVGSALLSGWSVNGMFNHYSGTPYSVTADATSCNCPGSSQTANQILPNVSKVGSGVGGQAYFNPLAYAPVTGPVFGTSGYDSLRGPGVTNLDMAIFRTFTLTERFKIQLRGEAMNVSNTPHFNNPGADVSNLQLNPNGTVQSLNGFSQITSTNPTGRLIDARYFRLGARITF